MTHTTPAPWYDQWLAAALDANRRTVFFIVGCQKSGTTWVQKLLDAHPHIAANGEGHFCDTLAALLAAVARQYNQTQSATNRMAPSLLLNDDDLRGVLKTLCDRTLAKYIATKDQPQHVRAVGDKTPEHANAIALLGQLYPTAKFIHIIRDGRDAALSGWAHLQRQNKAGKFNSFADYAAYFAGNHWKPYITNARKAGASLGEDYFELQYEQLHEQPVEVVSAMLKVLGVAGDEQSVQHCIDNASFEQLTGGRTRGTEDRQSHFRKGVVGDWRGQFDDEALRRFDAAAGDLLDALGYAAAGSAV